MVIWEHDEIIERWKCYYGKPLNEENPRTVLGDGLSNEGITPAINREEVEVALKGMNTEGEWDQTKFQWRSGRTWEKTW